MKFYSLLLFCGLSVVPVSAEDDVADAKMEKGIALMKSENWLAATEVLDSLINEYGPTEAGVKKFGTKFGSVYYNRGLSELKIAQGIRFPGEKERRLRMYDAAIESFRKCYAIKNTEEDGGNIYRVKSLLFIGNAQQHKGDYVGAIETYEQFLLEKNDIRDQFNLGDFLTNLAICHWLKAEPDFEVAEATFKRGLSLRGEKAPSNFSMITGMRAMLNAAKKAENPERAESFIVENQELIKLRLDDAADQLARYSQLIIKVADMGLAGATELLSSKIPEVDMLAEMAEKVESMRGSPLEELRFGDYELDFDQVNDVLEQRVALELAITKAREFALSGKAIANERMGDFKTAAAIYEMILKQYVKSENRADYLYNLSRVSVVLEDVERAYEVGNEYFTNYPEHEFSDQLKPVLMLGLYASQNYGFCIELGEKLVPGLSEESEVLDSSLFSLGASYFYEGWFSKALPEIERHYVKFPESKHREEMRYLHASVYGHVLQWDKSLGLLDEYITSIDESSEYMPLAIYDKAFVLYSMEEYDVAIKVLKQFIGNYNDSMAKSPSHILAGNIYLLRKDREEAEIEYRRALDTAKYTKNQYAEDEAYYLLISMLGEKLWDGILNDRVLDALPYFDAYMAGKPMTGRRSAFYTQIVASALFPLTQSGRMDEGYRLTQQAIFQYNTMPNTPGVEGALQNYLVTLRNANIADDSVIDELKISRYVTDSDYHQALLRVAELDVLERSQRMAPNKQRGKRISEIYKDLHLEYTVDNLDNFAKIKVAKFLENSGKYAGKAKNYYQGVIDSGSKIKLAQAQIGLLDILAKSDDPADIAQAEAQILTIIKNPFTAISARAAAHYKLLEILNIRGDWERLTDETIAYLQYPSSAKKRVRRAEMLLAKSYDERDLTDKAIGSYTAVWVNSMFNLDQSAPAMNRVVTLLWERNNPAKDGVQDGKSDRQIAYESAFKYIRKTQKVFNETGQKLSPEAEERWREIRDKIDVYGSDPEIKPFLGRP